ncbi:hypothetical protein SCA6_008460 [Theobroma cacao]
MIISIEYKSKITIKPFEDKNCDGACCQIFMGLRCNKKPTVAVRYLERHYAGQIWYFNIKSKSLSKPKR